MDDINKLRRQIAIMQKHIAQLECDLDKTKPKITNYDPIWQDGTVVCGACNSELRNYDGG